MDENRFGGSIMANGSDERVTPGSIVGDTMLRIGEGNLAESKEFQESALGQALFYIPSMVMGARVGNQIEETIPEIQQALKEGFQGLKKMFSQRKAKRAEWNALSDDEQRGYGNFRRYVRQTLRQKTQRALRQFQAGDDIIIDGQNLGERKMKNFQDRLKIRAFYLNGINDFTVDNDGKTVQNTPVQNVENMFTSEAFNTYQNPTGLINQYNQPTPVLPQGFQGQGMLSPANLMANQTTSANNKSIFQGPVSGANTSIGQGSQAYLNMLYNMASGAGNSFLEMYNFYNNNRQAVNNVTRNYMGARFGYGFGDQ